MVRTLPRAPRRQRRAVTAVLCAAFLSLSVPATMQVAQADHLHDKHKKVRGQIHHARASLDDSSKQLMTATRQLKAAQGRLASARTTLAGTQRDLVAAQGVEAQLQARLAEAEAALNTAQANVAQARQEVNDQRAAVGRLAAANYQDGDPSLMRYSVLLDARTPQDLTLQLNTADTVMDQQEQQLAKLRDDRARLQAEEVKVDQARQAVAEQEQQAAVEVSRRADLEQAASAQTAQVTDLVTQKQAAEGSARRARHSDLTKLKQLQAEDAHIQTMIMRAAARSRSRHYQGETGGFLYRPVGGAITSPYGWREHPIYHYWGLHDGNDYSAPCGTPEHAAGTGRVISEYYSSVWGNRLFINLGSVNGKNITVIYNHINKYVAHTGQRVGRGQVVAYAGTTGWSTGCHLHFTVMANGSAVDPNSYM